MRIDAILTRQKPPPVQTDIAGVYAQRGAVPFASPRIVTMAQAHLALLSAGKLDTVNAIIDALPSPQKETARIWFDQATECRRDHPLVAQLAPLVPLSDADLDALFTAAAAIVG